MTNVETPPSRKTGAVDALGTVTSGWSTLQSPLRAYHGTYRALVSQWGAVVGSGGKMLA